MRYPYRSVEIFDPAGPPKINGLALLDHEAPYLELPMLFANEVDDATTGHPGVASATFQLNYSHGPGELMLGSMRRGKRAILLFRFNPDEVDTMTKTEEITEEKADQADELETGKAPTEAAENFADDKDDGDDENMEDGGSSVDWDAAAKEIASGEVAVAVMDMILAAIQE